MCTAIASKGQDLYFGRTLDYHHGFAEEVVVTPRNYKLHFRHTGDMCSHHAMVGMAAVQEDYPLYYDAMNEKGLCMAGLNFVGNAVYRAPVAGCNNVAQFELVPWVLAQCASVREAMRLLHNLNITDTPFSSELPAARLHWLIADRAEAVTVESVEEGVRVYPNPVGVLTNNPPFPMQMHRLNDYARVSPKAPTNRCFGSLQLTEYSRGLGGLGLPGDLSSGSRFVRAAFGREYAVFSGDEAQNVGQVFHVLETVSQTFGCCEVEEGAYEYTLYTSCCSAKTGRYYYTTYQNRAISAVDMHRERLDDVFLARYPLKNTQEISFQN